MVEILKNKTFKFLNLSSTADLPKATDLVMIGDSQLHSAVYGSGLPTFYENAIGGQFRWGSKSWGGFSPRKFTSMWFPMTQFNRGWWS